MFGCCCLYVVVCMLSFVFGCLYDVVVYLLIVGVVCCVVVCGLLWFVACCLLFVFFCLLHVVCRLLFVLSDA